MQEVKVGQVYRDPSGGTIDILSSSGDFCVAMFANPGAFANAAGSIAKEKLLTYELVQDVKKIVDAQVVETRSQLTLRDELDAANAQVAALLQEKADIETKLKAVCQSAQQLIDQINNIAAQAVGSGN